SGSGSSRCSAGSARSSWPSGSALSTSTSPRPSDTTAEPAVDDREAHRSIAERRADLSTRVRTLGRYGFARASEEPYRRRPADVLWLLVSVLLVEVFSFHHDHPTQ